MRISAQLYSTLRDPCFGSALAFLTNFLDFVSAVFEEASSTSLVVIRDLFHFQLSYQLLFQ